MSTPARSAVASAASPAAALRATANSDEFRDTPVFVAGDAGRGQSLIVWGIAEGRAVAAEVDRALMGDTALPRPINPTDVALRA